MKPRRVRECQSYDARDELSVTVTLSVTIRVGELGGAGVAGFAKRVSELGGAGVGESLRLR